MTRITWLNKERATHSFLQGTDCGRSCFYQADALGIRQSNGATRSRDTAQEKNRNVLLEGISKKS